MLLLADSTKFGTVSKFNVAPLEKLDAVVTDDQLPREMQDNIRISASPCTWLR